MATDTEEKMSGDKRGEAMEESFIDAGGSASAWPGFVADPEFEDFEITPSTSALISAMSEAEDRDPEGPYLDALARLTAERDRLASQVELMRALCGLSNNGVPARAASLVQTALRRRQARKESPHRAGTAGTAQAFASNDPQAGSATCIQRHMRAYVHYRLPLATKSALRRDLCYVRTILAAQKASHTEALGKKEAALERLIEQQLDALHAHREENARGKQVLANLQAEHSRAMAEAAARVEAAETAAETARADTEAAVVAQQASAQATLSDLQLACCATTASAQALAEEHRHAMNKATARAEAAEAAVIAQQASAQATLSDLRLEHGREMGEAKVVVEEAKASMEAASAARQRAETDAEALRGEAEWARREDECSRDALTHAWSEADARATSLETELAGALAGRDEAERARVEAEASRAEAEAAKEHVVASIARMDDLNAELHAKNGELHARLEEALNAPVGVPPPPPPPRPPDPSTSRLTEDATNLDGRMDRLVDDLHAQLAAATELAVSATEQATRLEVEKVDLAHRLHEAEEIATRLMVESISS